MSIKTILAAPQLYTVIDDGQFRYPVLTAKIKKAGATQADLVAMDADAYGAWCSRVPMVREVSSGTHECIDLCQRLVGRGVSVWYIDSERQGTVTSVPKSKARKPRKSGSSR